MPDRGWERRASLRRSVRCVVRTLWFLLVGPSCPSPHSNPLHGSPLKTFSPPVRASEFVLSPPARESIGSRPRSVQGPKRTEGQPHNNKVQLAFAFIGFTDMLVFYMVLYYIKYFPFLQTCSLLATHTNATPPLALYLPSPYPLPPLHSSI